MTRARLLGAALVMGWVLAGCGGGGDAITGAGQGQGQGQSSTVGAASNVAALVVDSGPAGLGSVNTLFTTVTVCVPGTTQCQSVDHVQVDTGSYGLRLLASVLTIALPVSAAADGNSLAECTQFVDGYSWGPIASADVRVAGESAAGVPVQVIGVAGFAAAPAACSNGLTSENTVADFGANGIIGIGPFAYDCGSDCATAANSGIYYSCTQTACAGIAAALASQVVNPVTLFKPDDNGTIIVLPAVPADGAASVAGSLIFGVDTETNNASGTQTVIALDSVGDFTTQFNGMALGDSFIDSGTNGLYFTDTAIPQCSDANFSGFYCPTNTESFSATLSGGSGAGAAVSFSIANAETMANDAALPALGGTYTGDANTFDWGLPFFYGRRVFTVIEGYGTSLAVGPYTAF